MRGQTLPFSLRGIVVLSVTVAHAAAFLASLPSENPVAQTDGGAPVVNLTLEPAPRFDDMPSTANQVAAPAPTTAPTRSPPQPELRQPVLHPLALETVSVSADPVVRPQAQNPSPSIDISSPAEAGLTRNNDFASARAGQTQGGGASTLGATATTDEDRYAARVIAWVEAHKGRAGGRSTGVATIRFVLDRRGRIQDSAVLATSGDPGLDAMALHAIRNAPPFPRPPATAAWRTRTFLVRIDYRRKA